MTKTTTLFLTMMLCWNMSLPIGAQTPASISKETEALLQAFGKAPSTETANRFFAQLDKEEFSDTHIAFPPTTPIDTLQALVWHWASEYYYSAGHYTKAEEMALKALPLLEGGNDETTLADCLNILAIANVRMSRYSEAINYARQCYDLDKKSGDAERISMSLNNLAGLYLSAGQPREAEQYVLQGMEQAKASGLEYRLAIVEGMAAEVYHAMGEDEKAVDYAEKAYQREMSLKRSHKAMMRLSQKATALVGLKRYSEAKETLARAIAFFREQGNQQQSLGISLNTLGKAQLGERDTDAAIASFREAALLFKDMGDRYNEMHARQGLYESLWETNPDSAKIELNRFNQLKDSLYNMASAESLAHYNAEFGNDALRQERDAERTAKWRIALVSVTIVLGLLLLMSVLVRRNRQQAHEQQKRIKELLKEWEGAVAADDSNPSPSSTFLTQVNQVIHELTPKGRANIKGVSEALCMSPSQFRRRLATFSPLTPANYILAIRMDEAKHLLVNHPELTIQEIAERTGFADNAHFTHAFTRLFGTTPSGMRDGELKGS